MYNIFLFDLDGTITDPGIGITNSVAYALRKFGLPVPDRTALYKFIGPPLMESFQAFCGLSPEDSRTAIAYYREYYADVGIYENAVYDGVEEMLKTLRAAGRKLLLATSKPEEFANRVLRHFALEGYFDFVAGATMDELTRSTKGEVIAYALQSGGICGLSGVVMVGDRKHDILGAKQAGLDSIGVLYGYGSREELCQAGATHLVRTPQEICAY